MPTSYGQRLKLRLFLEGVEVPVVSANIRTAPNSPTMASIQIPPLAEATRFHPRTLVHLFFLDLYEQKSPFLRDRGSQPAGTLDPTAAESQMDSAQQRQDSQLAAAQAEREGTVSQGLAETVNDRYKLLFGGEVIGFQWSKNASNRSVVLQCADFSNYWDYAYQWNNTGIFGPGIKAVFSGGATNLFTDFLESKGSTITRIVASGKCNTFPKMKGLAAGVVRLIEAIGGTYVVRNQDSSGKPIKKLAGQNIFFSLAELRLRITQMLGAFEDDPTSERLLKRQGWTGLFNRQLGSLGGQTSIRKALNALSAIIFHETYGQPCPYFVPGVAGGVSGVSRQKLQTHPKLIFISTQAEVGRHTLDEIRTAINFEETGNGPGVTRIEFRTRVYKMRQAFRMLTADGRISQAPGTARGLISRIIKTLTDLDSALQKWGPQAPPADRRRVQAAIDAAQQQMRQLEDLEYRAPVVGEGDPPRLYAQIFRPDIWFGAPPRCNVLFPEDYDQLTYQRMFLQEPTRFLLKTNDEFFGEDELFDKFYFAPSAGSLKKDRATLQDMLKNDLLEHELFTGILPVFEKMGEFNVFASRSGTQQNPTKVSFAQRSANFLYFKHRFNARQMRVSGKFNPYVACGFPGLILDKYVDQATLTLHNQLVANINQLRATEDGDSPELQALQTLGTNFLGNFTEVSHSVSQSDARGTTEINISYPRQVDESVAYLGALERLGTVQKRQDKDALRATDVAALSPPKRLSVGPHGGPIVNVTNVTGQYSSRTDRAEGFAVLLPLLGTKPRSLGGPAKVPLVPIGVPTTARESANSQAIADVIGSLDLDRKVVFKAFRVEEQVPRYKRERAEVPAEEFIRPGWYGDIWTSGRIGQVYNTFFGTGAITDPQDVGVQNEQMAQAQDEAAAADAADDPRRDAPLVASLGTNASIAQAVEFLLLTYSYVRQRGLDVDEFVRAYTWRPIATLVDMFGTRDLTFSPDGSQVTSGIEGFHSRAFGPYNDIFGLVGPDLADIVGIKRGSTVAQKGDTRKVKQQRVQDYVAALLFSRGLLG